MKFQVRTNCEYILEIEANNEEEALKKAELVSLDNWEHSWASYEAEKVEE